MPEPIAENDLDGSPFVTATDISHPISWRHHTPQNTKTGRGSQLTPNKRLRLSILGPPALFLRGKKLQVPSSKAIALIGYLATRRVEVSRSELDGLLWPESDRVTARRSLRGELYRIGKFFPPEAIGARNQYVAIAAEVEVDLWQFERAIANRAWETAVTLYRGSLMEGLYVRNAEPFETWHRDEQERYRSYYLEALDALSDRAAKSGEIGAALAYTQQIIRTNPISEAPYIKAMKWAMQLNEHAMALDIYHNLLDVLKLEFGIRPSSEASRLAREVESAAKAD